MPGCGSSSPARAPAPSALGTAPVTPALCAPGCATSVPHPTEFSSNAGITPSGNAENTCSGNAATFANGNADITNNLHRYSVWKRIWIISVRRPFGSFRGRLAARDERSHGSHVRQFTEPFLLKAAASSLQLPDVQRFIASFCRPGQRCFGLLCRWAVQRHWMTRTRNSKARAASCGAHHWSGRCVGEALWGSRRHGRGRPAAGRPGSHQTRCPGSPWEAGILQRTMVLGLHSQQKGSSLVAVGIVTDERRKSTWSRQRLPVSPMS